MLLVLFDWILPLVGRNSSENLMKGLVKDGVILEQVRSYAENAQRV